MSQHSTSPPRYEWRHPDPRRIASGHCVDWLAGGWRLFMAIPGVWLQQSLLFMAILFAIGVVPLIGWAVVLVAFPVLSAGMLWTAAETAAGRRPGVAGLFIGLRRHAGNLLMVGIFYLLGGLLAGLVGALVGGGAALTGYVLGALAGMGLTLGGVVLGSAVFMVLWVVLIMALWFAPSLVLFHDVAPLEAMRLSVEACIRNVLPFALMAVMLYVLIWLAMLPAGLGMLVLVPVMAGAVYTSYQDVFGERPALPEAPPATDVKD